ncbi:UDP-N-acetylglucosamine acyltransferase [Parvularcula bermudensis HTCC2503]|uniref:Acyl-[acyl-carrier-protein]--UDP-N-acetylglucosamine O-acyltransferase n=1 Tax=Parvularcula bermudensis (strain ATCC BAA-594 / HTCC2503 / KCTC 12087) TaxID=314260 RepID=E0TCD0_PARBH|nr:acyl-ACP--UDP-N-acetylglucosamine O-acyltransferase [Parvularcula bermudensis]ADM08563.1 UDP-N-acetylglucosamine acyltransferase [Parvularcula bermudensis HTCC2503]
MTLHPTAIIEDGAEIGEGVKVGPFAHIGPEVRLGPNVHISSHAVVTGRTEIGEGTEIGPFCVIGTPPQHNAHRGEPTRLIIGKRNRVREHVTMHTGTMLDQGVTSIGDDCLLMVGAHIAHDCVVGNHVTFANNATLAGHCRIGDHTFLGGLSAMHQFCRVGPYAILGGGGILRGDLIPYGSAKGNTATLEGLNIIGMKRRGLSRETIHRLRSAFRSLFAASGTLKERVAATEEAFGDIDEVQTILAFLKEEAKRPLCQPGA